MKTHDAAKLIGLLFENDTLADVLKSNRDLSSFIGGFEEVKRMLASSPNVELDGAKVFRAGSDNKANLKALISLSKYDKQRWLEIIDEFSLPIDLNPRASTRDIVGKVLGYLDAHPEVLSSSRKHKAKNDSSNLEDTLNKLINYK